MYKMEIIQLSKDKFFVKKHIDKSYKDLTNKTLNVEELFNAIIDYNNNGILFLKDLILMKDKNNNDIIDNSYLIKQFNKLININKLKGKILQRRN